MSTNLLVANILVADEAWCALASLHHDYPERRGFTAKEILQRAAQRSATQLRPGVQVHIYQHNVANVPPSSARYRMFFRLPDGTFRLFLPGDLCDPQRKGKTKPDWEDLPARDRHLLDFYEHEFKARHNDPVPEDDPLVALRGLGRKLWEEAGGADRYVRIERTSWDEQSSEDSSISAAAILDDVWRRIEACEGQKFQTSTGLPFTYIVESQGLWPVREGKRINMKLCRSEIAKAIQKGRPEKVTDLGEFRDPSYLFSLLRDTRTAPKSWTRG